MMHQLVFVDRQLAACGGLHAAYEVVEGAVVEGFVPGHVLILKHGQQLISRSGVQRVSPRGIGDGCEQPLSAEGFQSRRRPSSITHQRAQKRVIEPARHGSGQERRAGGFRERCKSCWHANEHQIATKDE